MIPLGEPLSRYASIASESLIRACADSSDGAAWQEFVSRFHRAVSLSIIRTAYQWGAIPQQVVDDLVQETYLKLCADKCRLLLEFATQHPEAIRGYIKTIAVNVAHDHFKSLHSQKRGSGGTSQLPENSEPEAQSGSFGGQESMERRVLLEQIDRCLSASSEGPELERDRLIFWLYYRHGMSAKAIAALPKVGLTAKGVESAIFRLTRVVREQVAGIRGQNSRLSQKNEKGLRPAESY
jgi:RNA polymerase sigma-70 factor (ECF subfamily)